MHEFCLSMCSNLFKTAKRHPESRGGEYFAFPHLSNLEGNPMFSKSLTVTVFSNFDRTIFIESVLQYRWR